MLSTVATGARATAPAVAVVAQGTAAAATAVAASSTRGMATLRDMQQRLTSLENMGKITASMKMVRPARACALRGGPGSPANGRFSFWVRRLVVVELGLSASTAAP